MKQTITALFLILSANTALAQTYNCGALRQGPDQFTYELDFSNNGVNLIVSGGFTGVFDLETIPMEVAFHGVDAVSYRGGGFTASWTNGMVWLSDGAHGVQCALLRN